MRVGARRCASMRVGARRYTSVRARARRRTIKQFINFLYHMGHQETRDFGVDRLMTAYRALPDEKAMKYGAPQPSCAHAGTCSSFVRPPAGF